ncbi:MAG: hypothetical protein II685_04380 [Clostridia bacterium]|nr:hypothetical protein [Clostridia bacterium]
MFLMERQFASLLPAKGSTFGSLAFVPLRSAIRCAVACFFVTVSFVFLNFYFYIYIYFFASFTLFASFAYYVAAAFCFCGRCPHPPAFEKAVQNF